jgi:hypothetical protein
MSIRDRIKEFRRVPAHELQANPKNWRTHPKQQQDALRGIFDEVGIAGAVLARETPEGGLVLIDGHLRTDVLHAQEIPVLVIDVSEEEADKLLATMDPLSTMAGVDKEKLDELLRAVDVGDDALQQMLTDLAEEAGLYADGFAGAEEGKPDLSDGVVNYNLIFDDEGQQNRWYAWLKRIKDKHLDLETHAARIDREIRALMDSRDEDE